MITALRTCLHDMLPVGLIFEEEIIEHRVIGNKNTKKIHEYDCGAIKMMNADNIVLDHEISGDYESCSWCGHSKDKQYDLAYSRTLDHFYDKKKIAAAKNGPTMGTSEEPEDIEICRDERVLKFFKDKGCVNCDSLDGTVKMYPAEHGVRLLGNPHERWWIYFECGHCGYQTSLRKARQKR